MRKVKRTDNAKVTRIDWLDNCIDEMSAGRHPTTPAEWAHAGGLRSKDIDLLREAAKYMSLRPGASQPDLDFIARTRVKMVTLASSEE